MFLLFFAQCLLSLQFFCKHFALRSANHDSAVPGHEMETIQFPVRGIIYFLSSNRIRGLSTPQPMCPEGRRQWPKREVGYSSPSAVEV
jgi:hypothetical protein